MNELVAWLGARLRHAVEWCGFTPTQREAYLNRRLLDLSGIASDDRIALRRVKALIAYRESVGAGAVDIASLRWAIDGDEETL